MITVPVFAAAAGTVILLLQAALPACHAEEGTVDASASTDAVGATFGFDDVGNFHINTTTPDSDVVLGGVRASQLVQEAAQVQAAIDAAQARLDYLHRRIGWSCSGDLPLVLDCTDPASRHTVLLRRPCGVKNVINCCCDAVYGLKYINGSVSVSASATSVAFGEVQAITGDLAAPGQRAGRGVLQHVHFGELRHIGGSLQMQFSQLKELSLRKLRSVGSNLNLQGNELTRLDLGQLRRVGVRLQVNENHLSLLDLSSLHRLGSLEAQDNRLQTLVTGSALSQVTGDVILSGNELLALDLTGITTLVGTLEANDNGLTAVAFDSRLTSIGGLSLHSNQLAFTFPIAVANVGPGGIDLHNNDITHLDLTLVSAVDGRLNAADNALLQVSFGTSLFMRGDVDLTGNPDLNAIDCTGVVLEHPHRLLVDVGVTSTCP